MVLDDRHIQYLEHVKRGEVSYDSRTQRFKILGQSDERMIPLMMHTLGMTRLVADAKKNIIVGLTSLGERTLQEEYEAWA